jgi:acetoin:2,6-dichlorophenolindophenol oxidoreductase subunit beta
MTVDVRETTRTSYIAAVREALWEEMQRDERVFIMGEDVSPGVLGTTMGFVDEFGIERVRDTPISEAGFLGAAAGAAMVGMRPVVDMMISSFMWVAMDQLVSVIAKSTYMTGGQARMPITIRAALFYGGSTAAQHSDRPMATFMTIPGLKIIAPSNAADAKGLLKAAIRDDNPVLCFEDGTIRGQKAEVPTGDHVVPLGVADIKREGTDVTVVAIAGCVPQALKAAEALAGEGISVEVLDPRTLVPLDRTAILASVAKTGRLVIADVTHRTCGVAAEISATVAEDGFASLKAPIARVTTPDVHIPFSPALEPQMYPNADRIAAAVRATLR